MKRSKNDPLKSKAQGNSPWGAAFTPLQHPGVHGRWNHRNPLAVVHGSGLKAALLPATFDHARRELPA